MEKVSLGEPTSFTSIEEAMPRRKAGRLSQKRKRGSLLAAAEDGKKGRLSENQLKGNKENLSYKKISPQLYLGE